MVISPNRPAPQRPQPSPVADLYPPFPQVEQQLKDWCEQHPDIASLESLGKSGEGRDLWALRIGKAAPGVNPGLLLTGATHAREWNTLATSMNVAKELLENYGSNRQDTRIVDQGEVWVVPCLNPDGYQYTHDVDPMWRKNRSPQANGAMGVDLNRNYYDGNPAHWELYRPAGDTPGNTSDDSGPGYDDPTSDNFRGPDGASEKEVRAVTQFFLARPNVRGVVDHHSYGNDFFYPVPTADPASAPYKEVVAGMNAAMDKPFKVLSCSDIPIPMGYYSGVAPFMWNANGKIAFLTEMGTQFQPGHGELEDTVRNVTKADLSFADYLIDHQPARA